MADPSGHDDGMSSQNAIPSPLVGDGLGVPCVDGRERPYLNLDSAASASALPAVARRVEEFLPWYSSVHRGAGYKSRQATNAYEEARLAALRFAAQLAPHRPLPPDADYIAWSGHKMYAPYGAGVLIGPRATFADGDPFLAGGGAVDLVDLDEVSWTDPPEREEAGSPNVIGAVALDTAFAEFDRLGWKAIIDHDDSLVGPLRTGLAAIPGVRLLGPEPPEPTLPLATFNIERQHHPLVPAPLSAEYGIG